MNRTLRNALQLLLLPAMAFVVYQAFFVVKAPPPPPGGSFNAPEATRILFVHVPAAELCAVSFLLSLVCGAAFLATRRLAWDARSLVAVQLGLFFGVTGLLQGMAWAWVEWGAPWSWDPRQTGLALALMVYGAYLALRSGIDDPQRQARLAAVYAALAAPTALFLIFVLPYLPGMVSLHLRPGQAKMGGQYSRTIAMSAVAFLCLYAWVFSLSTRVTVLAWRREGRFEE